MKDAITNPSILAKVFKNPIFEKYPFYKLVFQNPQLFLGSHYCQMFQNAFKIDEKNKLEISRNGISVPPDPFENLNNNQMMNSSSQISNNINNFNNNSIGNKQIFENCGIDIDYKEKFKDQLFILKDMGFTNEENNIQVLKQSNGNINDALEKLSKYN